MSISRFKWIVVDPKICHGKPVFKGTRVLVSDVLEMLAEGMTVDEILEEYPQLNREMILEALALAAELLRRERRVIPLPT
ncbi:MAG: antitoxin [Desulfurococcales archaeon ex4484_217_2]|nr:MAG: antitoxin [Desulfurococcales archaeon ex4484_217_2]